MAKARPDMRLYDIGSAVQQVAETAGFSVVREYVGHGIGRAMHEEPQIPNFGQAGKGPQLKPGMVFAIEPMINAGGYEVRSLDDGWTVVTGDGALSAHFEQGPVILTRE
jgi:methionyl aminopeptidase